jgi:hypothetical protein
MSLSNVSWHLTWISSGFMLATVCIFKKESLHSIPSDLSRKILLLYVLSNYQWFCYHRFDFVKAEHGRLLGFGNSLVPLNFYYRVATDDNFAMTNDRHPSVPGTPISTDLQTDDSRWSEQKYGHPSSVSSWRLQYSTVLDVPVTVRKWLPHTERGDCENHTER